MAGVAAAVRLRAKIPDKAAKPGYLSLAKMAAIDHVAKADLEGPAAQEEDGRAAVSADPEALAAAAVAAGG